MSPRISLLLVAAVLASPAVAGGEKLVNGAFEEESGGQPVGWKLSRHYRLEPRGGMNGTRGIVAENDDPDYGYPLSQKIMVRPGFRYRLRIAMRGENVSKDGLRFYLEWYDGTGKWIAGKYRSIGDGTHDWKAFELDTGRMPTNAASARAGFGWRKTGVGKAWFDDFSVRALERKTVVGLHCDAYRSMAWEGDVRFVARLDRYAGDGGESAFFSYADAQGKTVRRRPDAIDARLATVTLPVDAFAEGRHPVRFELRAEDGRTVGSAALDFTRLAKDPGWAVRFDRSLRTIADGKPFFPLGMYFADVADGTVALDEYARTFNCLMPYEAPDEKSLDLCAAKGLKVMYPINRLWPWKRDKPGAPASMAEAQERVRETVARFRGHPALLAWYANDELPLEHLADLVARQKLLEEIDPGHPSWTVLYQYWQIADYYPSFDVIGTDPYPVGRPNCSLDLCTKETRATRDQVWGCKPLWQVPQAFDWRKYGRAEGRLPTREEYVNMAWQAVANGANGLVFFHSRFHWRKGRPNADTWADICVAAEGVKRFIPVFLSPEPEPAVAGVTDTLSARAWRQGGTTWLAVVNAADAPCAHELGVGARFEAATCAYGAAKASVPASGTVKVELPPLGVAMVRLTE